VLPADFWYFNRFTEVLAPLRGPRTVSLAVLAPGVTPATAKTVLERDARERDPAGEVELRVVHVREPIIERVRPTLLAVGGAVALVLLIACGNAAVLFLVRATQREREFAIRAAIGAGRARLARHLVVEAVLVAALGAVLGLGSAAILLGAVADGAPRVLGSAVPGGASALHLDGVSIGAGLASALLAAFVFAVVPLASAWRGDGARVGDPSGARASMRSAMRSGLSTRSFHSTTSAGWKTPSPSRRSPLASWRGCCPASRCSRSRSRRSACTASSRTRSARAAGRSPSAWH
jgi:hypothetical protein